MRNFRLLTLLLILSIPIGEAQTVKVKRSSQIINSGGYDYYSHKVKRGETLYALSQAYKVSEDVIIEKNPFISRGLKVKQTLLIPTEKTYQTLLQKAGKPGQVKEVVEDLSSVKPSLDKPQKPLIDTTAFIGSDEIDTVKTPVTIGRTREFSRTETINITLFLPFKTEGGNNNTSINFFNGVLIALQELKTRGISTNLEVISFGGSDNPGEEAHSIIESGLLDQTHLIIGPIHQDDFKLFVYWATENRVPIVSPLDVIGDIESPYAFQATPDEQFRYEKLAPLLKSEESNVIVMLTGESTDNDFLEEIKPYFPSNTKTMERVEALSLSIFSAFDRNRENIVILPVKISNDRNKEEVIVSAILEKIALQNSGERYRITVVGHPRWDYYGKINTGLLFKFKTIYMTNYHEDRSSDVIYDFYKDYIKKFDNIPSRSAMRGYDVTLLFVSALSKFGPEMPMMIGGFEENLLQVKYHFKQKNDRSSFRNVEWPMINYTPNFEILVK